MDKKTFNTVSVDSGTYSLLNRLSEVTELSKSAYLRVLIRNEAMRLNIHDDDASDGDPVVTSRNGKEVRMSELSLPERVYTKALSRAHVRSNLGVHERLSAAAKAAEKFTVALNEVLTDLGAEAEPEDRK